ncbi:MAG: IclR family transcriptional regulator [Hyphomicrobiales bacterium]|nr:IclR family transcriptional regulator [Hyphomicrobiales bacterium]
MIRSVEAAIRILLVFAEHNRELGVTELAEITGFSKSHVAKVLSVLKNEKVVEQDRTRKYRVGQKLFMLGSRFVEMNPLARLSLPRMRELADKTGHSITLTARSGDDIVHVVAVDGENYPDCRWRVGRPIIHHTSAVGRVLLAYAPRHHVEQLIVRKGLPPLTSRTITDRDEFFRALAETRERGYAGTWSEGVEGLGAIAVPVMDRNRDIVAALAAIFPAHLVTKDEEIAPLRRELHRGARRISLALGCSDYTPGRSSATAPSLAPDGLAFAQAAGR